MRYLSKSEAQALVHMLSDQGNYVCRIEMQSQNKYAVIVEGRKD